MNLPLNQILQGDSIDIMQNLPAGSVDIIFADPPYNLQLEGSLERPDASHVDAVEDDWDKFEDFAAYDDFTKAWLTEARRLLSPRGTIWVIGTYHNIHRVGTIMQDLGYWLLNDVAWVKTNPMPQFKGVRFCNAFETLIWAKTSKDQKGYTFNYQSIKAGNEDVQVRSDWNIPLCNGNERLRDSEGKVHSTQKPEALISRILTACTNPGDIVLDPFFGSGTTGAVARKLHRDFIGIERDSKYIRAAEERISKVVPLPNEAVSGVSTAVRLKFLTLLDLGLVTPGETVYFQNRSRSAIVRADGSLYAEGLVGSIHGIGAKLENKTSCNGWDKWHVERNGELKSINDLRNQARDQLGLASNSFL